jgi:lysozyme
MIDRRHPGDLSLSPDGMNVIADRESLELEAYLDERGILTIGIGHTSAAGPPKVIQGMKITEEEAHKIFRTDNQRFRKEVIKHVHASVTQYEFDATASFLFNIGSTNFLGSTFLKRLNAGNYEEAAEAMLMWMKPPSLRSRRMGEYEQFKYGRYVARVVL